MIAIMITVINLMLLCLFICLVPLDCPFIVKIQASSSSNVCSVQGVTPRKVKMWCQMVSLTAIYQVLGPISHECTEPPRPPCPHLVDTHGSMLESVCLRHRKVHKLSKVTQYYQWNSTPDSSLPSSF